MQREFGVHEEINKSPGATKWKRQKKDSGLNSGVLRSRSTFRNTESRVLDFKPHISSVFLQVQTILVQTMFG
jgi:hypothetical protein